jgi:hypothetical protein
MAMGGWGWPGDAVRPLLLFAALPYGVRRAQTAQSVLMDIKVGCLPGAVCHAPARGCCVGPL